MLMSGARSMAPRSRVLRRSRDSSTPTIRDFSPRSITKGRRARSQTEGGYHHEVHTDSRRRILTALLCMLGRPAGVRRRAWPSNSIPVRARGIRSEQRESHVHLRPLHERQPATLGRLVQHSRRVRDFRAVPTERARHRYKPEPQAFERRYLRRSCGARSTLIAELIRHRVPVQDIDELDGAAEGLSSAEPGSLDQSDPDRPSN